MQHIILLISLSSLLFSSSMRYSLPQSYYEAKNKLQKSAAHSKTSIYLCSSKLDYDINKILKSAIKNKIQIQILHNFAHSDHEYEYYKLFKYVQIKHKPLKKLGSYIIFDKKLVCYSPQLLIKKDKLDEEYALVCSEDKEIVARYIKSFKRDFQAN